MALHSRLTPSTAIASAAVVAGTTVNSSSLRCEEYETANLLVNVTAATGSLLLYQEVSIDDTNWYRMPTALNAAITSTGKTAYKLTSLGLYMRIAMVDAGGSETVTMYLDLQS